MADVTVPFDRYLSGTLPDICVFTGKPTSDRMVLRTRIIEHETAVKPRGPLFKFVSQAMVFENPRKPRNMLVGKLPVDAEHLLARQRTERYLRLGGWVSLVLLIVAAVTAQSWSPLLAVVSIAAIVAATVRRVRFRGTAPTPTLIGAGTRVHLANVHESFVDAVESGLPHQW